MGIMKYKYRIFISLIIISSFSYIFYTYYSKYTNIKSKYPDEDYSFELFLSDLFKRERFEGIKRNSLFINYCDHVIDQPINGIDTNLYKWPNQSVFVFDISNIQYENEPITFVIKNATIHNFNIKIVQQNNESENIANVNYRDTLIKREYQVTKNPKTDKNLYLMLYIYNFEIDPLDIGNYKITCYVDNCDSIISYFNVIKHRKLIWDIETSDFYKQDSINISIINPSFFKFYCPGHYAYSELIIESKYSKYINNKWTSEQYLFVSDCFYSIPFEGYEKKQFKIKNPLMSKLKNYYNNKYLKGNLNNNKLNFKSEDINNLYHSLYGDSLRIVFYLETIELSWSPYESQYSFSQPIYLNSKAVYDSWKNVK